MRDLLRDTLNRDYENRVAFQIMRLNALTISPSDALAMMRQDDKGLDLAGERLPIPRWHPPARRLYFLAMNKKGVGANGNRIPNAPSDYLQHADR